jgi:hypothetical protein
VLQIHVDVCNNGIAHHDLTGMQLPIIKEEPVCDDISRENDKPKFVYHGISHCDPTGMQLPIIKEEHEFDDVSRENDEPEFVYHGHIPRRCEFPLLHPLASAKMTSSLRF